MTPRTTRYWGSPACVLGGMLWALLGPAAILETNGTLSYDTYNRLLAAPLLLFLVGFISLYQTVRPNTSAGRAGFLIASLGFILLFAGNLIEFWGVLLQSEPNAQRASELGLDEHWVGSDIGWMIFGLGMLELLIGGPLAALATRNSPTLPRWLVPFVGLLLAGVLAGNLFASAPFVISLPIFASYGAGWIALGVTIWKMVPAWRSTLAGSRIEARDPTLPVLQTGAARGPLREEERPL